MYRLRLVRLLRLSAFEPYDPHSSLVCGRNEDYVTAVAREQCVVSSSTITSVSSASSGPSHTHPRTYRLCTCTSVRRSYGRSHTHVFAPRHSTLVRPCPCASNPDSTRRFQLKDVLYERKTQSIKSLSHPIHHNVPYLRSLCLQYSQVVR